jgi:hypothetical protein
LKKQNVEFKEKSEKQNAALEERLRKIEAAMNFFF